MKKYILKRNDKNMTYSIKKIDKNNLISNKYETDIEAIIKINNFQHIKYMEKLNKQIIEMKKIIDDRDLHDITPDPNYVNKIRKMLVEAGIVSENGGLTEPYKREE